MSVLQQEYDEAMFAYSSGDFDSAVLLLRGVLAKDPDHFDAQLAMGMAHYRKGDYSTAIAEGLRAERMRPDEQLVHTNLSLFYQKAGDRVAAERHGLQARIASWREEARQAKAGGVPTPADSELQLAQPRPAPLKFPSMPWKKKPAAGGPPGNAA